MLRVQIRLYIWPETQISRSSVFRWRVMTKRSEISAYIVWGGNRKPYAASSNPPLYLTSIDLETHVSRSSILLTTINGVLWPNGQSQVPIVYVKQIGNRMLRVQIRLYIWPVLTLKPIFQGHPFLETTVNGMFIFVAKRSEISANVCMGANRNPYPVSSNPPWHFTLVDFEHKIWRSLVFWHSDTYLETV